MALLLDNLERMPHEVQCVALDTLQRIRSAHLAKVLFRLFDSVDPPNKRCKRMEMSRAFQSALLMSGAEDYRQKVVKALATIAEGNSEVMSWLRKRRNDESVASGLRDDMTHILQVLRERD